MRDWQSKAGSLPPEIIADEHRAREAYPLVVLLTPRFAVAELVEGRWQSFSVHEDDAPGGARASLIGYLRVVAPTWEKPGNDVCAAYASAADALERGQLDDISAAGRRFRIARIERYVRMRADGPEPPRPSDFDPHPPPAA